MTRYPLAKNGTKGEELSMVNKLYMHVTLCVAFISFILIYFTNFQVVAKNHDLNTIIEIVEQKKGHITEWSLYAREEIPSITSISQLQSLYKDLKDLYPNYEWKVTQKDDQWEAIGTTFADHEPLEEKLQILATLNKGNIQTYIVYAVNGSAWNKEAKSFIEQTVNHKMEKIFDGNPLIFSCVKGEFSDTMESDFLEKGLELTRAFQTEIIETVNEEGFTSITGESPLFQNEILTKNQPMNIQISLRSEGIGAKPTFVIGTPIITIEY